METRRPTPTSPHWLHQTPPALITHHNIEQDRGKPLGGYQNIQSDTLIIRLYFFHNNKLFLLMLDTLPNVISAPSIMPALRENNSKTIQELVIESIKAPIESAGIAAFRDVQLIEFSQPDPLIIGRLQKELHIAVLISLGPSSRAKNGDTLHFGLDGAPKASYVAYTVFSIPEILDKPGQENYGMGAGMGWETLHKVADRYGECSRAHLLQRRLIGPDAKALHQMARDALLAAVTMKSLEPATAAREFPTLPLPLSGLVAVCDSGHGGFYLLVMKPMPWAVLVRARATIDRVGVYKVIGAFFNDTVDIPISGEGGAPPYDLMLNDTMFGRFKINWVMV